MSQINDTEARLRRQIAEGEAKLDALRAKLAKLVAKKAGEKAPATGLELLWKEALPIARNRSTKHQCRTEWNRIPVTERPSIQEMIDALKAWNRSEEWRKDGNAYVPALHRWIKHRGWESVPEVAKAPSRHRTTPKPVPVTSDDEAITDRAELAKFLSITPDRNKAPL